MRLIARSGCWSSIGVGSNPIFDAPIFRRPTLASSPGGRTTVSQESPRPQREQVMGWLR